MSTIDLADVPQHLKKLEGDMKEAAVRGLRSAALRGVSIIITQIVPARSPAPIDRGAYRAGWKADVNDPPDGATIYNDEANAALIENGVDPGSVKPGYAMIENLTEWALRKGIAADEEEAVEIAWSIANSARSRGFFYPGGLGILRELVDQHLPRIIEEEVKRELGRLQL